MVYVLMDYREYTLSQAVLFSSKAKLQRYVESVYGDYLLKNNGITIDWENGEVWFKGNLDNDDPIAIFSKKKVK